MKTAQSNYAQMSREELLQKVEELQAWIDQFENNQGNLTTKSGIYVHVDMEDAYQIQNAIRNLVGSINPEKPDIYFAMKLIGLFTPSLGYLHDLIRESQPLNHKHQCQ